MVDHNACTGKGQRPSTCEELLTQFQVPNAHIALQKIIHLLGSSLLKLIRLGGREGVREGERERGRVRERERE